MADIQGKFYNAVRPRTGTSPSLPPTLDGDPQDPVNPPGTNPNHPALTLGTNENGLTLDVTNQILQLGLSSSSTTGALSSTDWSTFNGKIGGTIASGQVAFGTGANTIGGNSNFIWDNVNSSLSIGVSSTLRRMEIGSGDFQMQNSSYIRLRTSTATSFRGFGINSGNAFFVGAIDAGPVSHEYGVSSTSLILRFYIAGSVAARFDSTGFGVGNITPTNTLDVNGTARIRSISNATGNFLTTSATGVIQQRTAAEVVTDLGIGSGLWTAVGSDIYRNSNVLVGATAFVDATAKFEVSGRISQTALGFSVFVGEGAGRLDDLSNNQNVYIGYRAGYNATTASFNTYIGVQCGLTTSTGSQNTAFGAEALLSNSTGSNSTLVGYRAGRSINGSGQITAVGHNAASSVTSGQLGVAIGLSAAGSVTTSNFWTSVGSPSFWLALRPVQKSQTIKRTSKEINVRLTPRNDVL